MRHDEDYKSFTVAAVASRGARIRPGANPAQDEGWRRAGVGTGRGSGPARGPGGGRPRPAPAPGPARLAQPSSAAVCGKKTAARPDSRRATGTRKGEQET